MHLFTVIVLLYCDIHVWCNGVRYLARLTKYHAGIILIIEMFGVVCVLRPFCICCALPKGLAFVKIGEDTPVPRARSALPPVEHAPLTIVPGH